MTTSLEVLAAGAMKLAPADRTRLLERLIASLDVDSEVEQAWELAMPDTHSPFGGKLGVPHSPSGAAELKTLVPTWKH